MKNPLRHSPEMHDPKPAAAVPPAPAPSVSQKPAVRKNPLDCPECGKMINHSGPHGAA